MPSTLRDICFDAADAVRVARFWSEVLGYEIREPDPDDDGEASVALLPPRGEGIRIWFNPVPESKTVKNRVHIDINMPSAAEMDRIKGLGATFVRDIRGDDGELWWTIMADPEGNEFCAFPPRKAD